MMYCYKSFRKIVLGYLMYCLLMDYFFIGAILSLKK
jgi:hypothetical protein